MQRPSLCPLFDRHRVVLCVGCGGVGKTTISASLALAAAQRGKHVLCLTIDPARRLANALGLSRLDTDAQRIEDSVFASAGLVVPGSLTVMMLDAKRTFDELVGKHSPTVEARDRILNNRIYAHLSERLAGTQEYMAMEKVLAVQKDPAYDFIVLDTPPTTHALDFLDAPERLIATLDSPMAKWFAQAYGAGHLHLNLVAKSAAVALRGVARLMGGQFIELVAEFITELDALFGGFKSRAAEVARAFRSDDFAYVLVTSPAPDSIREVLFFARRLAELGLPRDAIVVNRLHRPPRAGPDLAAIEASISRLGLARDASSRQLAERVAHAIREEVRWARRDAAHLDELEGMPLRPGERGPIRVDVPALPSDVHDVSTLAGIAALLCPRSL